MQKALKPQQDTANSHVITIHFSPSACHLTANAAFILLFALETFLTRLTVKETSTRETMCSVEVIKYVVLSTTQYQGYQGFLFKKNDL